MVCSTTLLLFNVTSLVKTKQGFKQHKIIQVEYFLIIQ